MLSAQENCAETANSIETLAEGNSWLLRWALADENITRKKGVLQPNCFRLEKTRPLHSKTAYEVGRRLAECADRGRRQVTHEDYWERITFFLEKIIHTAKGNDVRMAFHPPNPPGLPFGYGYINALIQAVNSEA